MELLLQKHEILDLGRQLQGTSILCQAGSCWLTQTGDDRDHILHPGAQFSSERKGRLILTATEDCRLRLVSNTKTATPSTIWKQRYCNP